MDPFATDPFASTPENTQEAYIPEPEETFVPQPSSGRISVTLKQSGAHGAPWIVAEGSTVSGVEAMVNDVLRSGLPQTVAVAAKAFADTAPQAAPLPAPQQTHQQAAPQQSYQRQPQAPQQNNNQLPPGVQAPFCNHGQKRYIVGQYGPFWGCPANRDDPSRCKPQKFQG